MTRYCDLHTHSYYSDGTCTPEQVVRLAAQAGLSAVALCDHSCVRGLPEFSRAGAAMGIETVWGCEFSTDWRGHELHILGLFLTPDQCPDIEAFLAPSLADKERSNRLLAHNLTREGYEVDYDALCAASYPGQVNRAHFAAELTRRGYVPDRDTAFRTLLHERYGLYHPSAHPGSLQVLGFLKEMGIFSVLAHPFLSLKDPALVRAFLTEAAPFRLGGMEVFYSKDTPPVTALAQAVAKEFSLAESGGSDFHGENKPDIAIGTGKGNLRIPLSVLRRLQQRHEEAAKMQR